MIVVKDGSTKLSLVMPKRLSIKKVINISGYTCEKQSQIINTVGLIRSM